MKTLIWIVLMVCVFGAHADTLSIDFHGVSYHLNRDKNFNEKNYGIGIRYTIGKKTDNFFIAGTYKNSDYQTSTYIGMGKELYSKYGLKFGVTYGAVSGYKQYDVVPFATPYVQYKKVQFIVNPFHQPVVGVSFNLFEFDM